MVQVGRSGVRMTIRDTGPIKAPAHVHIDLSVGIQPEDQDKPHHSGLTLGELGAVHEFGSAVAHIPARMWFRGWADRQEGAVRAALRAHLQEMVRKQQFSPAPLQGLVHRMKASLVGRIVAGQITPPNAARTLAGKSPETRPLIDTKQFVRAIAGAFRVQSTGGTASLTWRYKTPGGEK